LIYEDISENYSPGMLKKTVTAMEYIDQHYSYDFFVRTNIGTFWDFPSLLRHVDKLPNTLCYSGDGPFPVPPAVPVYLSGTDTIVNRHMIKDIVANKSSLDYKIAEDMAMGLFFHVSMGAPFLPSRIAFMESFRSTNVTPILEFIAVSKAIGADHYRVKNKHDRNKIDIACYIQLCQVLYGINLQNIAWEI